MPLAFDELNALQRPENRSANRSVPYRKYFGEMHLTDEEVEERIHLAGLLEDAFKHLFSIVSISAAGGVDIELDRFMLVTIVTAWLRDAVWDIVEELEDASYIEQYIEDLSSEVVDATIRNIEDAYYTSEDRAKYIAENEANTIYNDADFQSAVEEGKTSKTWVSMEDNRVRETHAEIDGVTIPIGEPFMVGNSMMMFPKDTSLDADPEEIVNCRCTVMYGNEDFDEDFGTEYMEEW